MGYGHEHYIHKERERFDSTGSIYCLAEDLTVNTAIKKLPAGATQKLPPFPVPDIFSHLVDQGFTLEVSLRSSLAQLGLDLIQIAHEGIYQNELAYMIENHSLHTVGSGDGFDLGKLFVKGSPLTQHDFDESLDHYSMDPKCIKDREGGRILIPLSDEILGETEVEHDKIVDLNTLPTGSLRGYLHNNLHIGVITEPREGRLHLAHTAEPVSTDPDYCLYIVGCIDVNGNKVEHGESRLMYGGYEWNLITETYAPAHGGYLVVEPYRLKMLTVL